MFGFRGRFGRRKDPSKRGAAIDEGWLRKLNAVLPGDSIARVPCDAVPETFALLAAARDAEGVQWLAAVSPRSGLDAALALAAAIGRGVAEANARLVAASPDWTGAARRLAAGVRPGGRAIALATILPDGESPDDEPAVFVPVERMGAGFASADARALFARATEGLRGLAAKHGGGLRSGSGEVELVIAAAAIAALRAEGDEPILELRWPSRSTHPIGSGQLADALDRLEGQIRKRLGERDARDGELGLRARLARAFAGNVAPRFSLPWPLAAQAEPADAIGVADDGSLLVLAARERVGLAELSAVMQAGAALEPALPLITQQVAPPVRVLERAKILIAGLSFLPGVEEAAAAVEDGPLLYRAGAIEGPFTRLAPSTTGPSPAARPPVISGPASAPLAPVAEAPAAAGAPEAAVGESDEEGEAGPRRRRRRGRRRGRAGRAFDEARDETAEEGVETSFETEPVEEDGERAAEAAAALPGTPDLEEPAASPGGFETISLLDLEEDSGAAEGPGPEEAREDGARRRRRRRGRGRRRGGDAEPGGDEEDDEPAAGSARDGDEDDHAEVPELAEAPELGVEVPSYEDEEEEPESELDRVRHERERRRRERAQSRDGAAAGAIEAPEGELPSEERGLPRGRVVIVAHADRESIAAAVLLAREMRQLEGLWIYAQEDLMTFFRGVATDLREDTPIYLLGFAAKPARDAIQAAALYQGRLVWFDHHEWPPEDVGAMRDAIGAAFLHVRAGAGSVLPLVLPHCGRRSRFSDKLVDLVTGRFTTHDFQRWGRLWWWRLGQLAAKKGERRADLDLLIAGRPSDLAREAERCEVPAPPAEVAWASSRDFRIVHFAGIAMVIAEVPAELDLHLALRVARERFGALLGLGRSEGESTFVLAAEDSTGRRPVDVGGMAAHLGQKFSWVETLPDDDHVARVRVLGLDGDPSRLDALIAEIGMGRSLLEG